MIIDFSHTPGSTEQFLDAVYRSGEGYMAMSFKRRRTGEWHDEMFEWPQDRQDVDREIARRVDAGWDVYACSNLMETADRRKGNAARVWVLSFELDAKASDPSLLHQLNAVCVASGTPDHQHVYVLLAEATDAATANRLTEAIAKAVSPQVGKWEDNALLRVPDTKNFKTEPPRSVRLRKPIGKRWSLDDLETLIASRTPKKAPIKRRQGTRAPGRQGATEAGVIALLDRYANVAQGERNQAFHHIVRAAAEEGMSQGVVQRLLTGHAAAGRFEAEGRLQVEIERSWPDDREDEAEFVSVTFSDVHERKVEWLWYGWLPVGKIVMMDGDPGVSKSTLALTIAGHVSAGREWPDGRPCSEGDVIVLSAEDDPDDTMKPRLRLAGAKMDRVHLLTEVREDGRSRPPTLADIGPLRRMIKHFSAKLVIVDVFMSYIPGKADSHKDQDVRAFLFKVKELASETGCAFLMLRHLNKSSGANAKYRGGGSIGITGQARAVWTVGEDPERPGVRVLSAAKVNNAPRPASIAYELDFDEDSETGRIRWAGLSELSADDLVTEHTTKTAAPRRGEAETALMGLLTDAGGSMPSADLTDAMEAAGHNSSTTHRAKKALGVESRKDAAMDGRWTSYLPNVSSS